MDAVEYLKQKKRMTQECTVGCEKCLLGFNRTRQACTKFQYDHPKDAVAIVEKWAEEHPPKTYMSVFLEKFPNANMNAMVANACVEKIFGEGTGKPHCKAFVDCEECWNREVEE